MAKLGDSMKYDYGFIGAGNMGTALSKALNGKNVAVSNRTPKKAEKLAGEIGAIATTNVDIVRNSRFIILAVKPQTLTDLFSEIKDEVASDAILVTMAAGVKMETICSLLGRKSKVIRIMPNTPVAVGDGVILVSKNDLISESEANEFLSDFAAAGTLLELPEDLIDAASVISGCGPAYAFMFMDALSKAGEKLGLDPDLATKLAEATVKGSATLAELSPDTLETLRIKVCSPGGSTIEGVKVFEKENFYDITFDALKAAFDRTKELSGS